MTDTHELERYEGRYQFVATKHLPCAKLEYVQVSYDQQLKLLSVKGIGGQQRHRRQNWISFGPLDGESRLHNTMFVLAEYHKYIAERTDDGWRLQQLRKDCQWRFFCGRWRPQEMISLTEKAFHVGLPQDTEQCTYLRLNSNQARMTENAAVRE